MRDTRETRRPRWAIWITGLPGSGKSVLARAAADALRATGLPVKVLELDEIRKVLTPEPHYTEQERDVVYRALGYMAVLLTEAGIPVLIDATAHRRMWRDLVRAAVPLFAEVQLVCPLEVCQERERTRTRGHAPRGIYQRAGRPGAAVPGVDVPYEPALAPELVVDTAAEPVSTATARITELARRLEARAQPPRSPADRSPRQGDRP
jgi:adenylylsulfate kinase